MACETVQVYDAISNAPCIDRDYGILSIVWKRAMHYYYALDGGIAGAVVAFLVVLLHIWLAVVEYLQPKDRIEIMPDFFEERDALCGTLREE